MISKIIFDIKSDRIGPDIPFTHFLLYFPFLMRKLCKLKFGNFGLQSSVRPGVYAVNCSKIYIGNSVTLRPGTKLFAEGLSNNRYNIEIEDKVLIGSDVHIYVSNHEFSDINKPIFDQGHNICKPVKLNKGCWIGAKVVILPGVTIGKNSVVAAGSVVTKNVADFTVVGGVPAKLIKNLI